MANIYWRDAINKNMGIVDRGASYTTTNGDLIFWHGQEALEAQQTLAKASKKVVPKQDNVGKYRVKVPATKDMSPYTDIVKESSNETLAQNALWHYNNARAHDGLSPLSRMPVGTKYVKI